MSVVSVSLNDKLLEDIDDFMDEQGFSGRSEVMRTAVRALLRDRKEISGLEGTVDAVIIVTHEDEDSGEIDDIQHDYQETIRTQLHNHMDEHKCLEVFMLHGEAEKVKELYNKFQASSKVEQAKIIVP
ncbi:nickel-responsive regulator 1 [Nanohaloarchaea archaeon SG9]|nr:nickel-responsive regulator 1 [Nanohaloarchaea archaeon SG9]